MPLSQAENIAAEEVGTDHVRKAQLTRLTRWYMALGAYGVVILAVYVANLVGLDSMPAGAFVVFFLFVLLGNMAFGFLIKSNRNLKLKDPSLTLAQMMYSVLSGVIPLYFMPRARLLIILLILLSFTFGMLRLNLRDHIKVDLFIVFNYGAVLLVEFFRNRPHFQLSVELFQYILTVVILAWFTFFGSFVSNLRHRLRLQNVEIQEANEKIRIEMDERERAQVEKDKLIIELKDALRNVKTLSGLLPICSSCKKIRDDKGYWNQLEAYIHDHSQAQFSHGICPECAKKLYPDFEIRSRGEE